MLNKIKEKFIELCMILILIIMHMIFAWCILYLWFSVFFYKADIDQAYIIDKTDIFFTDENSKKKHILLKKYPLDFLNSENDKICNIVPKTKLISEVICEPRKTEENNH